MADMLEVYWCLYDHKRLMVCMYEQLVQLIGETCWPFRLS